MVGLKYENGSYKKTRIPDGNYPAFAYDMSTPCTCPNCGKTFEFGDMYTSRMWYRGNGTFALYVCEKCYEAEVRE